VVTGKDTILPDMKINIKILGAGCSRCNDLAQFTAEAVREGGFNADIQKIGEITEIMKYQILSTPALVINEKVVSSGKVLSKAEIIEIIRKEISV
jgi:small redox-active disulfide protein 2